jgi:two-component system nitrate/nitrite response regulator NarL
MYGAHHQLSIVLADDHPVVLHGLADMLRAEPDITVMSLCPDGLAAATAIRMFGPDIAILYLMMPRLDALGVIKAVGAETRTRFILLTASASDDDISAARAAGVAGIVFKDATAEDLIASVRAVAAGHHWYSPKTIEPRPNQASESSATADLIQPLSRRECEVAKLVARGLSNKEVGRLLNLSEGTVKIHLHKIYGKIGVPNRTALAALNSNGELTHRAS